jgi:hypothetical protein
MRAIGIKVFIFAPSLGVCFFFGWQKKVRQKFLSAPARSHLVESVVQVTPILVLLLVTGLSLNTDR